MAFLDSTAFKNYRQISGTDAARDARIAVAIAGVIARIEKFCGLNLSSTSCSETFPLNKGGMYLLGNTVSAITSVTVRDNRNIYSVALTASQYYLDSNRKRLYVNSYASPVWSSPAWSDPQSDESSLVVVVNYTGASLSGTDYDGLRLAALQLVDYVYSATEFGQGSNGYVASASMGSASFSAKAEEEIANMEKRLLNPYRKGPLL